MKKTIIFDQPNDEWSKRLIEVGAVGNEDKENIEGSVRTMRAPKATDVLNKIRTKEEDALRDLQDMEGLAKQQDEAAKSLAKATKRMLQVLKLNIKKLLMMCTGQRKRPITPYLAPLVVSTWCSLIL